LWSAPTKDAPCHAKNLSLREMRFSAVGNLSPYWTLTICVFSYICSASAGIASTARRCGSLTTGVCSRESSPGWLCDSPILLPRIYLILCFCEIGSSPPNVNLSFPPPGNTRSSGQTASSDNAPGRACQVLFPDGKNKMSWLTHHPSLEVNKLFHRHFHLHFSFHGIL